MTQVRTIESVPFASDLAAALAVPGVDAMRVAEDFFGLADLFKENARLGRALTDPARTTADKQALAAQAFSPHVTSATMSVINVVVAHHWRHPADVTDALEVLGILGVLNAAGAHDDLDLFVRSYSRCATSWPTTARCVCASQTRPRATPTSAAILRPHSSDRVSAHGRCASFAELSVDRTTVVCCTTFAGTRSGRRPCRTASSSLLPRPRR